MTNVQVVLQNGIVGYLYHHIRQSPNNDLAKDRIARDHVIGKCKERNTEPGQSKADYSGSTGLGR